MSTQVTLWGTNGRMIVDRQEVKTFIRATPGSAVVAKEGWDVRYTTDFHNDVWYYLRGEEYSAQLDHFFRCIVDGRRDNISSFASAAQTDRVVSAMLQNAGDAKRRVEPGITISSQSPSRSGGFLSTVKGALR
jgi:hypothetical protein